MSLSWNCWTNPAQFTLLVVVNALGGIYQGLTESTAAMMKIDVAGLVRRGPVVCPLRPPVMPRSR